MATGEYVVMPHMMDPSKESAYAMALLASTAIDLIELMELDNDPRVKFIVDCYFKAMEDLALAVGALAGAQKDYWRTFMKVYDWNDVNHDGLIQNDEKGDPYWIEIAGVIGNRAHANPYVEGNGYDKYDDAIAAGGTAVGWALDNGGRVSESAVQQQWVDKSYTGWVYLTDKPYPSKSGPLGDLERISGLISAIQEIKDKIGELIGGDD